MGPQVMSYDLVLYNMHVTYAIHCTTHLSFSVCNVVHLAFHTTVVRLRFKQPMAVIYCCAWGYKLDIFKFYTHLQTGEATWSGIIVITKFCSVL